MVDGVRCDGIAVFRSFVSPLIEWNVDREKEVQPRKFRISHQK
jgi:hypothetical protein